MRRDWMPPAERRRRVAFYRRVQQRLDDLELTRADFARRLGRSKGTVSDWFNLLSLTEDILRLPRVLRCSGHWLLTGEGSPRHQM